MDDKCFACGRRLVRPEEAFLTDRLSDGRSYTVYVGPECIKLVKRAGSDGYQPPKGGPRLYFNDPHGIPAR